MNIITIKNSLYFIDNRLASIKSFEDKRAIQEHIRSIYSELESEKSDYDEIINQIEIYTRIYEKSEGMMPIQIDLYERIKKLIDKLD